MSEDAKVGREFRPQGTRNVLPGECKVDWTGEHTWAPSAWTTDSAKADEQATRDVIAWTCTICLDELSGTLAIMEWQKTIAANSN